MSGGREAIGSSLGGGGGEGGGGEAGGGEAGEASDLATGSTGASIAGCLTGSVTGGGCAVSFFFLLKLKLPFARPNIPSIQLVQKGTANNRDKLFPLHPLLSLDYADNDITLFR